MTSSARLTPTELALWHQFKLVGERVNAAVERDILAASDLTGAEFGVLTRLVDLGDGSLRQGELATSMRWNKSRLSHQITRMEKRDLVTRSSEDASAVTVSITDGGRRALKPARPAHAESIREHLTERLSADQRATLASVFESLLAE
ncbi:MarR family winged helix-turn-helix transcriptional regulator [Williamsia maris]|uniref:DNA-binding transcriptional regulator, MarR family n=1 Tax=Williamsia maris TaxID=72806 RepID=A0ABT1HHA0_9NOCA|nr:MarR family transcriptional regulator [Williamsia maris]MCP2177257.1 DNA-binding transcriptional regulator, MarR family [Williamsia maris]